MAMNLFCISTPRKELEKVVAFFKEAGQKTGEFLLSEKSEQLVNGIVDAAKGVVTVAGTAATVALAACPVDGPVGEVLTGLATPAIVAGLDKIGDAIKTGYSSGRKLCNGMIDSETGKISVSSITDPNNIGNFKNMAQSTATVISGINNIKNNFNSQNPIDDETKTNTNKTR